MKNRLPYFVAFFVFLSFASCVVRERYVVRERPAEVVYVRPASPSPQHIWISGDWIWSGGGYHWREGHWERRREGRSWHEGHWQNTQYGWKWMAGHWG